MNLTRCENGHFYDADKYASCPHCSAAVLPADDGVTVSLTEDMGGMVTEALENDDSPTVTIKSESVSTAADGQELDDGKTIGYYSEAMGTEPVVGWLVCLNGTHFGEGFPLKSGRNFIGRSSAMDIVLDTDTSVSRERHAIVIYEPRGRVFIAQPGDSRELFYLNENVVLNNIILKPYDQFLIGRTKLLFVPLCGKDFSWDEIKKED